jgi:hypothetical protein
MVEDSVIQGLSYDSSAQDSLCAGHANCRSNCFPTLLAMTLLTAVQEMPILECTLHHLMTAQQSFLVQFHEESRHTLKPLTLGATQIVFKP